MPAGISIRSWWSRGELTITRDHLTAELGRVGAAGPWVELAEKLLRSDDDTAIRAIVPKTSGLWALAGDPEPPHPAQCEIRVAFGEPIVVACTLQLDSPADAAAWTRSAERLLARWRKLLLAELPYALQSDPEVQRVFAELFGPEVTAADTTVTATSRIHGLTPALVQATAIRTYGGK